MATWQVETQCPQCGAPLTLGEAQHLFTCPYCKTRLFLTPKGFFRYALPPKRKELPVYFLPFWRIKGLSFTLYLPPKTRGRPIDRTLLATDLPLQTYSLGLRPQATKLVFAHTLEGSFLPPTVSFKTLLRRVFHQLNTLSYTERKTVRKGVNLFLSDTGANDLFSQRDFSMENTVATQSVYQEYDPLLSILLDEGNSLIYLPLLPERGSHILLNDGVTSRPLGKIPLTLWEKRSAKTLQKIAPPDTLPLICPNCGWDLIGAEDSVAVGCSGCHRVWEIRRGSYSSIPYEVSTEPSSPPTIFLPFWKMETHIPEFHLYTHRDLMEFAQLSSPRPSSTPLYLFAPAFKVQPRVFLNLCRVVSLAKPSTAPISELPHERYPILLPLRKVQKTIPLIVAEIGADKERFFPLLPQIHPHLKKISLAFLPFRHSGYDLTFQGSLPLAIPRNALKWGRKL